MIMYSLKSEANRANYPKRADISAAPVASILLRNTLRGIKMKQIKLPNGQFALVDDADYNWLNQWKWYAQKRESNFYVVRDGGPTKKRTRHKMHREIMGRPKDKDVDHRDGNGLNNRRSNLRICTRQQNGYNCKRYSNNTSGYKGVSRRNLRWRAYISSEGKTYHLGYFLDKTDAARAYDKAAVKYFGEFARLNFG